MSRSSASSIALVLVTLGAAGCARETPAPASAVVGRPASPPPAADVVAAAVKTARAQDKVVLVEFGASWCTWCRNFEAFVKSPEVGALVQANYVIVNLTVREEDEKKALENPGGAAALQQWGGTGSIPFYVFIDATGKKIGDSNAMPDGGNIGFPAKPDEVEAFMRVIDKTARHLTAADRSRILDYLNKSLIQTES